MPTRKTPARIRAAQPEAVIVYTDGGCDPNPGVGGWAAILSYKGAVKELSGGETHTTNNRMEMTAAIRAIEALTRPCSVVIHTDSEYLKRGVTEWMPKWKQRGWTRGRHEVKNVDLWQRLDELIQVHRVEWRWVRGHAGNILNERCDQLAAKEIAARKRRR